jgi:hypothetical protein
MIAGSFPSWRSGGIRRRCTRSGPFAPVEGCVGLSSAVRQGEGTTKRLVSAPRARSFASLSTASARISRGTRVWRKSFRNHVWQ